RAASRPDRAAAQTALAGARGAVIAASREARSGEEASLAKLAKRSLLALWVGTLLFSPAAFAAAVDSVFGGRVPCHVESGVPFCPGPLETRVESFDGVPLDVSLTLPPADAAAPFPLVVQLHGWSLGKSTTPFVADAQNGYAVLSYTARGFYDSCGSAASRAP